jgi:glycosyltransferase involved in cell wall biosynthesis
MKLSVIIPVYNEESTIGELIDRVLKVPFEKELIIVDDGSRDQTRTIVERSHVENMDEIKVFVTPTNFGKGAAIRIGLQFVTGDVVIIQDADLELDPAEYVNLVRPIQEGKADVVYGSRFLKPNPRISWKTRTVNKALATFTNVLFGIRITDESTCYKVFRADLIKEIPLKCVGFEFCPEVTAKLARSGHRIVEVPIGYHPRNASEGKKLRFFRHGSQAVMTLMRYRFWKPTKPGKGA